MRSSLSVLLLALPLRAWAAAPVGWTTPDAEVVVHLGGEAPTAELRWAFQRVDPAAPWSTVRLVDALVPGQVRREGAVAGVSAQPSGTFVTLDPGVGSGSVTLTGIVNADGPQHAVLHLPPAPGARVRFDAPGLDVAVEGAVRAADGTWWIPADGTLAWGWQPHRAEPEPAPEPVVRAEQSTAAWVQDGAWGVRSRVRFIAARGQVDTVQLDVSGLDEVELTGAPYTRSGNVLTLQPPGGLSGLLTVDLTARRAAVNGAFPAPTPIGVRRVASWFTLGKPDEGDVVPSGGAAVSARALPPWARGLSESTPVAYWGASAPTLTAGRFEAVMGPDTVVESAEYVVAQSEDGHVLARATYLVRNERRQYLTLTPPPGMTPLTARVSGRPALLLREGDRYLVPLEKSIETVRGLLAFPVEVAWVGEDAAWDADRRASRALRLPAVDAPIQAARWEVHLPRGWKPSARAAGPPRAGLDAGAEQARESWTNAIAAYKDNDFHAAQRWLDAARGYAASAAEVDATTTENVARLQSNLDVLLKPGASAASSGGEDVVARRVRDLANAKTTDAQNAEARLEEDARKAMLAGDDARAAAALEQVTKIAEDIGVTEQKESSEQADKLASYSAALEETRARATKSKQREAHLSSSGVGAGRGGSWAGGDGVADGGDGAEDGEAARADLPGATEDAYDAGSADDDEGRMGAKAERKVAAEPPPPPAPPPARAAVAKPSPKSRTYGMAALPAPAPMAGAAAPDEAPVAAPAPMQAPAVAGYEPPAAALDDAVTGTFSTNFNYDAVETDEEPAPEVADAASEAPTPTAEFLARIPSGRSYQEVVAQTAGVVASTPMPSAPVTRNAVAGVPAGGDTRGPSGGRAPAARQGPSARESTLASEAGSLGYLQGGPSWTPPPSTEPVSPADRARAREQVRAERAASRAAARALASRTRANRNQAPDTRERRNPLVVEASPLTPALPLDGPVVTHAAALLDAGQAPTFTYTASPDRRSDHLPE